jgi:hypothetical protein
MAISGRSDVEIGDRLDRDPDVVGRKRRELKIRAGITPALALMLARVNTQRRFRLQKAKSLLEVA